jgi:cytochrome c oxidase subunit 1
MVAYRTPMLWAIGFVVVSIVGGLDVVTLAYVGANRTVQDTYFEAGYEHRQIYYAFWWAAVFGIFSAWYYFFPKIARRTYSDFLGVVHFWLSFISAAVLVPQNIVVEGIGRATANLNAFSIWNQVSLIGSYLFAAGVLIFVATMALAFLRRRPAD